MLAGAAAAAIRGRNDLPDSLVDPTTAAATAHGRRHHLLLIAITATHLEVGLLGAAGEGRLATRGLEAGLLEDTLESLHGRTTATTGTRLRTNGSGDGRKGHLFVLTPTEFYAEHVTQAGGSTVNCWALAAPLVRR